MTTHLPTLDTPDLRYLNVHVTAPAAITVALRRETLGRPVRFAIESSEGTRCIHGIVRALELADAIAHAAVNRMAGMIGLTNLPLAQYAARHEVARTLPRPRSSVPFEPRVRRPAHLNERAGPLAAFQRAAWDGSEQRNRHYFEYQLRYRISVASTSIDPTNTTR